jgi:hypothetical protein
MFSQINFFLLKGISLALIYIKELFGGKSFTKKLKCFVERLKFSQKIYKFCHELKVWPKINLGFSKREIFNQKLEVRPKINMSFGPPKKFSQEEI